MATKNKAKSTTKAAAGKPAKAKPGKPAKDAATAAAVEATPPAPQATEGLVPEAGPKFGAPELAPAAPVAATEAAPATPKAAKRGRAAVSAALPAAGKKLSALDAAAKVLGETATPMTSDELDCSEAMSRPRLSNRGNRESYAAEDGVMEGGGVEQGLGQRAGRS